MAERNRVYSSEEIAQTIDHALLKPEMTEEAVIEGCELAAEFKVFSVCVKPSNIGFSKHLLASTKVKVGTVIGFPHGGQTMDCKLFEAADAIQKEADELDMVLNIGALKFGETGLVGKEIEGVVRAAAGRIVKVIFETALLTDAEIVEACKISEACGASFVKTSTGFSTAGATIAHVELMRCSVGSAVKVKASGGIRSREDAIRMLNAGAERLGTAGTRAILCGETGDATATY